jgi:UDP-glucose 4-epimerase
MKWLITGGAGFIGSHLVDAILERDLGEVVVLDSFFRGRREYLARHQGSPSLHLVEADIRDADRVNAACRNADMVVHLAARSNVMGSEAEFQAACETNVAGTLNVLDAALKAGVQRLVFSSSREVYGDPETFPVHESSAIAPKNLYGASKAAGETYCNVYRHRGLDVRVVRLANVFGPRDRDRVIPLWLDRAINGRPLQVYGGGQVLDLIWIRHTVEALLRAADVPSLPGPINIGSGIGTPICELAEAVIRATGSNSTIEVQPPRAEEVLGYIADVTQMRAILGIEPPSIPLEFLSEMVPVAQVTK